MKNPLEIKNTLYSLIIAVSLAVMAQTASAAVLFSDDYIATSNQSPNDQINNAGRQGGTLAPLGYIQGGNVQIGNTTTLPIDPGDASSGDSFLAAFGGSAYVNFDFSIVTGPLEIDFKGIVSTAGGNNPNPTDWVSFNIGTGAGAPFVNNAAVSSILFRASGATELFNFGTDAGVGASFPAPNFDVWTNYEVIVSDTAGTGSAFVGNGSRLTYYANGTLLGTFDINQLTTGQGFIGFSGDKINGYDNVTITGTLPSVIAPTLVTDIEPLRSEVVTGAPMTLSVGVNGTAPLTYLWYNQSGLIVGPTTNSYTFNALAGTNTYYVIVTNSAGSVTSSVATVFSAANFVTVNNFSFENGSSPVGWTVFNFDGFAGIANSGYSVQHPLAPTADWNNCFEMNVLNGDPTGGIYQDVGALLPNTTYTLTVAIGNRSDAPPGGAATWSPGIISLVNGTNTNGTVLATGGGVPSTADTWQDYTAVFNTGSSVSGDLTVILSVAGAPSIQANFDNVRLTTAVSLAPSPLMLTNTTPASATVALGSNVVFTAAYSNSPPVSLQWQQIASGPVTNNINTGVVTVTNNGVVSTTLTLNNVQLSNAGSYRVKAANATNLLTIAYSQLAPLTVVPPITWYPVGTYNYTFTNDAVLALAGTTANEVYGVNFGVGPTTTANNYVFDDYQNAGNFSIAGTPGIFSGFLGADTTGDGNLDQMLNNGITGSSANTGTLNNLTIGQTYTVLVLLDDTRTSGASGPNFTVTDGLTTSPVQRFAFTNGVPAIGGYIMGTFTAAATTQPLTVLQNGSAQYVAILLETGIATPPHNAPELTVDLAPPVLEVTTGSPITLPIQAGGTLPLHYQWLNQSGPIGGANSTNYVFNAVAGTNYYSVVVTNSYGSVTSSIVTVISAANIVTVNNFSFEAQVVAPGNSLEVTPNGPTSWTAFNVGSGGGWDDGVQGAGGVDYTVFNPMAAPADGKNFFWVNRYNGNGTQVAGSYQDVGTLQANTAYTLTVAIGSRADRINSPGIISLVNGTDNTGTVLATGGGLPSTQNTWQDYTVTFTNGASASGDLTIMLSGLDAGTIQADFDNVRLTKAPVLQALQFGSVHVSGGNLILTATGGTSGAGYTLLSTTNLLAPINWTTNSAGTLDGTGAFSNAIPVTATPPAKFFQLRLP